MHDDEMIDQLMQDVQTTWIVAAVAIGAPVAAAASVYGRRLAGGR